MKFYKKCRVFDPQQVGTVPNDINKYSSLRGLDNPSADIHNEWDVYMTAAKEEELPEDFNLDLYWKAMAGRIPKLAQIARELIWQRTNSVDAERSFSQYKTHGHGPPRESH